MSKQATMSHRGANVVTSQRLWEAEMGQWHRGVTTGRREGADRLRWQRT